MKSYVAIGARARRARGVTLFEVLIVVAILAMISSGVAIAVITYWKNVQIRHAGTSARNVRGAVKTWWVDHSDTECPSVDDLIKSGVLDRDSTRADPWGESWRVECADHDVTVISTGPDRKPGTEDDIRIPPA